MGAIIPPVVKARKNSTGTIFSRPRINIIEGSGVTVTMADDATDNEIDITIDATGGGAWGSITGTLSDQTDIQTAIIINRSMSWFLT